MRCPGPSCRPVWEPLARYGAAVGSTVLTRSQFLTSSSGSTLAKSCLPRPQSTTSGARPAVKMRSLPLPPRRVSDGIEDLAQGMESGTTGGSRVWQMGLDDLPLLVGEVSLVCSSHGARNPTGSPPQDPFSDSFLRGFSERALLGRRVDGHGTSAFG